MGKLSGRARHGALAAIEAPLLGEGLKQIAMMADIFTAAKQQKPTGFQSKVEHPYKPFLQLRLEVDQQVTATNQVEFGKRRISNQILFGE